MATDPTSATSATTIPPPPDPTDAQLKRTSGDKIGGFLGAISRPGSVLGTISDAFQQAHEKRLGKAKMYHDVMVEKLARANSPDVGEDERREAQAAYDAAKAEYLKLAPDPETKKNMTMRTAIAEHHVKQGAQSPSQPAGAAQQPGSMSPPPAPSGTAGGAPSAAATPPAMTPPPSPPNMTDTMAGIPGEMQRDADARTLRMKKAEQDIITAGKVEEEKAKPPTGAAAKPLTPTADAYFSLLDTVNPKTGANYTPDEALKKVTEDTTKAGRPTPFQEYMSDPGNYAKFQAEMAKAKQSPAHASIGAVYGIYRMMEMGYKQNPEILPIVAQLAPQVFASAGMKIPPAMAQALGKIPLDQPLSPVTGAPIGTSMPGAPTGATRNQAQTAARVIGGDPETGASPIEDITKEVDDLKGYLGPTQGRINVKYLLGKVGSTGDADKDQKLSQLRTDLMFLASAAAKFHLNSVRAMEGFERDADAGKDSVGSLKGFLKSVEGWAKVAQRQERGYGETNLAPPPSPSGGGRVIEYDAQGNRKK